MTPAPPSTRRKTMSDDLVKRLDHFDADDLHREAADRIEALEARAEKAEAERDALRKAGDRLSFCAQTSGGTAGTDDDLVDAINEWADARALKKTDT